MADLDLFAWADANAQAFRDNEHLNTFPDRDAALIRWTLGRLGNDWLPGSPEIVHMLACKHEGL